MIEQHDLKDDYDDEENDGTTGVRINMMCPDTELSTSKSEEEFFMPSVDLILDVEILVKKQNECLYLLSGEKRAKNSKVM